MATLSSPDSMADMVNRPDILLVIMDDQRFDTIRALGNPDVHTPTLDRLAARGMAFTHAHHQGSCVPAVCMPSRAMLLTGRSLRELPEDGGQEIPADLTTLPETLRAAGYRTCGVGKWHNGPVSYHRLFDQGDAIFFGGMHHDHFSVPFHHFAPDGVYARATAHARGVHSSTAIADAVIAQVDAAPSDQPLFTWCAFLAPHDPRQAPPWFRALYDEHTLPLQANVLSQHPFDNGELRIRDELLEAEVRTMPALRRHLADYYAMISHADFEIGRIVDHLERSGRLDNTIIAFTADHGLAVGRHGLMGKQNLYDHSLRVPLLISGPGIAPGGRSDALMYQSDLHPTLLDWAGLASAPTVSARSAASCLRNPEHPHRDHLLFAYLDIQRGIRIGTNKLIAYAVNGQTRLQGFDLATDPDELHDLADDSDWQSTRDHLLAELRRNWHAVGDANCAQGQAFWSAFC